LVINFIKKTGTLVQLLDPLLITRIVTACALFFPPNTSGANETIKIRLAAVATKGTQDIVAIHPLSTIMLFSKPEVKFPSDVEVKLGGNVFPPESS
jgi:hypothetical protein